jgi:predicted DNA-binding transcriptional regulator YafY
VRRTSTRAGYRAIPTLTFEPEELAAVLASGQLARKLDDPLLTSHFESAVRKLTFDLHLTAAPSPEDDEVITNPHRDGGGAQLRQLGTALLRLKRVTFAYHTMSSDRTAKRTVEPYGLFLQSGHWYLAARDVEHDVVRNFRVSRMSDVAVNAKKPQSTDYAIPRSFRPTKHARSRKAWELGDGDVEEATVKFVGSKGAVRAAASLGHPVRGAPGQRRFQVRRADVFVRWLLSFAGDAVPLAPPRLVEAYRDLVRETLAVYDGGDR